MIQGIPKELWTVANGTVWEEMRGLVEGFRQATSQKDPIDLLEYMENPPSSSSTQPFALMTDRTYWIATQTATILASDVLIDEFPKWKVDDGACSRDVLANNPPNYVDVSDPDRPLVAAWFNHANCQYMKDNTPSENFEFYPSALAYEVFCFAASNPTSDVNGDGLKSGPRGVFCSSQDFRSLYDRDCSTPVSVGRRKT